MLVSLERDGEKRENLESHNVCCEAQLLPGAAGYRAPGFPDEALAPQMNHPSAEGGDLLRPALESRTLVDLDAGEELGNDEDVSTTQPGTPAELTEDRPRNVCMSFGQAPITETTHAIRGSIDLREVETTNPPELNSPSPVLMTQLN